MLNEKITDEIQDVLDTVVHKLTFGLPDVETEQPPSAEAVQEFIAGVRDIRELLQDLQEYVALSDVATPFARSRSRYLQGRLNDHYEDAE